MVVGAGFYQFYTNVIAPSFAPKLSLNQICENAIEDAIVAKESEVYGGLTPIVENNSNLIWQSEPGNESVLVVVWTKYASSYPVGQTVNTSWGDTWVTAAPQIQVFFKDHVNPDSNITLRQTNCWAYRQTARIPILWSCG